MSERTKGLEDRAVEALLRVVEECCGVSAGVS